MMDAFERFISYLQGRRVLIFYVQLCVSATALGRLTWKLVSVLKNRMMSPLDTSLYPWTAIFFHPVDSGLFNYIALCLVMGLCALVLYILWNERTLRALDQRLERKHPLLLLGYVALSLVIFLVLSAIFVFLGRTGGELYYSLVLLFIVCLPALLLVTDLVDPMAWSMRRGRLPGLVLLGCLLLLVFAVVREPMRLATGPVYLMNEYPDLFGETLVNGRFVRNNEFLDRLKEGDAQLIRTFFRLKEHIEGPAMYRDKGENLDFLLQLRSVNLSAAQARVMELLRSGEPDIAGWQTAGSSLSAPDLLKELERVNMEEVKQFFLNNSLEYAHQNMGRGQVNHLGHIYNPLNEYRLGKPLNEIYFQYGLGNTFLMKWVMDAFGGLSLQTYHKLYLFYLLYAALFIAMLVMLFRDRLYVLGVFTGYAAAFFWSGHIGLVLGAGLIPSIHLLDTVAIMLLALYLRRRKPLFLVLLGLSCMASLFINTMFGLILAISAFATALLHAIETGEKGHLLHRVAIAVGGFLLVFFIPMLVMPRTSGTVMEYFFAGYFSWLPHPAVVFLTVIYLVVSYGFMLLLKGHRFEMKYIYLFSALYAQGLLVYFYWSGLLNHLPMALPFLALQLFVMLYILVSRFPWPLLGKTVQLSVPIVVLGMLFLCAFTFRIFYAQGSAFYDNFRQHRTYQWAFDRARVVTTMNPQPFQHAVKLIQKYSTGPERGIYIISNYDGLVPFLADRYSVMPHFELGYSLFSEKQVREAVKRIQTNKPRYLFVDSDLVRFTPSLSADPWSKLYVSAFDQRERASRIGRSAGLHTLFSRVADGYEKKEDNGLTTVFERRNSK
jgi:hypothetical protein